MHDPLIVWTPIKLSLVSDARRVPRAIVLSRHSKRVHRKEPAQVIEFNLSARAIDVDAEVTGFTYWLGKEPVSGIDEVAVHAQSRVGVLPDGTLPLSGEVRIRMHEPDCPVTSSTSPRSGHEGAVCVRLGADEKRVRLRRPHEVDCSADDCSFIKQGLPSREGVEHQFPACRLLLGGDLFRKLEPRLVLGEDTVLVPLRSHPRRIADLEVKAAFGEYRGEAEFPVEEALIGGDRFYRV